MFKKSSTLCLFWVASCFLKHLSRSLRLYWQHAYLELHTFVLYVSTPFCFSVNFNDYRARQELRQLGYRSLNASDAALHSPQRQDSPAGRAPSPKRTPSPAPQPQRELTAYEKSQCEYSKPSINHTASLHTSPNWATTTVVVHTSTCMSPSLKSGATYLLTSVSARLLVDNYK